MSAGYLPTRVEMGNFANINIVQKKNSAPIKVLLLDAPQRQTLACMRVFAQAGIPVGAVTTQGSTKWVPSFKSRWCSLQATVPDFAQDSGAYIDGIMALLDEYPVELLLPAHDGSIEALRKRRLEIESKVALPLASESALNIAVSKTLTMQLAGELGIRVPHSIEIKQLSDIEKAIKEIGSPAVIKPVQSWANHEGIGKRLSSISVLNVDDAKAALLEIFTAGGHAVLQEWLPGRREAVSLFYAQDRFWAKFAQVSHREWPVLGGASVMCESIPLLPDITEASERLIRTMNLEGISMVEFRRDREGHPCIMEVNPRMAGSVALAISCGVNFPRLIYDWATGERLEQVSGYCVGNYMRWLAGDIWNLKDTYHYNAYPDSEPRLKATTTFLTDFIKHPKALNVLETTDFGPAITELNGVVFHRIWNRVRRCLLRKGTLEVER